MYGPGYELSPELVEIIAGTPAVEFLKAFRVTKSGGVGCSSLRSLITSFARSQAKDPRDMVYGLLALSDSAEDTDNFTPDYTKPPHELYVKVVKASLWKRGSVWSGADNYLVSFGRLLQQVFGDPFWDSKCDTPLWMKNVIPSSYDLGEILEVGGLVAKKVQWDPCNTTIWENGSFAGSMPGDFRSLRHDLHSSRLEPKDFAWLNHGSTSNAKDIVPLNNLEAHSILEFNSGKRALVYNQKFTALGYWGSSQSGSVLLSTPVREGEYLCCFKDCQVAAIVRENWPGVYSIVRHATVCGKDLHILKYWMVEYTVRLSFERLQMLTI
jgi:hypothetical protein